MDRIFGLDTLMATLGIKDARTFDAYWSRVMSLRENQELDLTGATWDIPQFNFTYEQLMLQEKISAMATYVSISSEPIPSGAADKITVATGSIPRQKVLVRKTEEDMRNEVVALQNIEGSARFMNVNASESILNYIKSYVFRTLDEIPTRHRNSLNYALGQVKSKGKLELFDTNNPGGLKNISFDMNVPVSNYISEEWFGANMVAKTGVDPIKTLREKIREIRYTKYTDVWLEWNEKMTYYIVRHPSVLPKLGYELMNILRLGSDANAAGYADGASDEQLAEAFRRVVGADGIHINKAVCGVDKYNKTTKSMETSKLDAFDFGTITIRPGGLIAKIKNVTPMIPDDNSIYARIFGNHGLVAYRYDAKQKTQEWCSELTVLPVLTRANDMYFLKVCADGATPAMFSDDSGVAAMSLDDEPVAKARTTTASAGAK